MAVTVQFSQPYLGIGHTDGGKKAISPRRLGIVLLHARAALKHSCDEIGGTCIASLGERARVEGSDPFQGSITSTNGV